MLLRWRVYELGHDGVKTNSRYKKKHNNTQLEQYSYASNNIEQYSYASNNIEYYQMSSYDVFILLFTVAAFRR